MDEKQKKILLIGGALLVGYFVLMGKFGGKDYGIGGGGGIGTFTISQDPLAGGDAPIPPVGDTYYNIMFPESADIILPPPDFTGGGGYTTKKERNAFATPPALMPEGGITKGIAEAAVKAEKQKESLPPQFQWR